MMKRLLTIAFLLVLPLLTVANPGDIAPTLGLELGRTASSGYFIDSYGRLPPTRTDLSATWRTNALVVTVRQFLKDGAPPRATGDAARPISMFEKGDATIEMFFNPGDGHGYQVSVNPSNLVYTARDHLPWNGFVRPVATRAYQTPDHWGVTFTVPFGAFGEPPPVPGERRHYEFAAGLFRWRGGFELRYGDIVFGARQPVATIEAMSVDADDVLHVSYAVAPKRAKGEIPHKNLRRYEVSFAAAGEKPFTLDYPDNSGDRNWLALDRFYFPSTNDVRLAYAAKDFSRPLLTVRDLASGRVVFSGPRTAAGELALGRLPAGEYALRVDEDGRFASCQFEVTDDAAPDRADRTVYPLVFSQDLSSHYKFTHALSPTFRRAPNGCHYRYDASKPFVDGARIAAGDPQTTFYRLAYEAQFPVRLAADSKAVAVQVPDTGAFYRDRYRELKAKFPDRTFTIHVDGRDVPLAFLEACDIFEFAFSYGACPLAKMKESIDARLPVLGQKPFFVWLPASLPDNGRYRTPDELNTMVRYSILRGAAGNVFHLGHGSIPRTDSRLWSYLRGCERATNRWYPDWARGTPVDLKVRADAEVAFGARRTGNRTVLIAVNLAPCERTLDFDDPAAGLRRKLTLTGSGSVVLGFTH